MAKLKWKQNKHAIIADSPLGIISVIEDIYVEKGLPKQYLSIIGGERLKLRYSSQLLAMEYAETYLIELINKHIKEYQQFLDELGKE